LPDTALSFFSNAAIDGADGRSDRAPGALTASWPSSWFPTV